MIVERWLQSGHGRDMLCIVIQYSMLLVATLATSLDEDRVSQLKHIQSTMNFTRMAMRFGRPQRLIAAVSNRHSTSIDPLSLLRTVSDLFLLIFFLSDHAMFL